MRSTECPSSCFGHLCLSRCFDYAIMFGILIVSIFAARCYAQARPMPLCRVCLSVTFVYSVETNKRIFKIFSPPSSHAILVFLHQTLWQYFTGDPPPKWRRRMQVGRQKLRFSNLDQYLALALMTGEVSSTVSTVG